MRIYSAFTIYNELDLLELRLREMYDHVDMFVIVEGNTTFRSNPKPFLLKENWDRYQPWHDKMRLVTLDDMPVSADPWQNEQHQRNAIMRGLDDADPDDLIIIGDVDEILRPEILDASRELTDPLIGYKMPLFYFRYNYMLCSHDIHSIWCMGARRSVLDHVTPDDLRRSRHNFNYSNTIPVFDHSGWHFAYLGDTEFVAEKIRSFSHSEVDTPEIHQQLDVEASIRKGTTFVQSATEYKFVPVDADQYMPRSLMQDLEKYKHLILEDSGHNALDFLPAWQYTNQ
jgi:hypothetical protein